MPVIEGYGARRAAEVMNDTWGHLAPERGREYVGTVVYTHGCYGDLTIITADFDGLDDSPWFFEHLNDWLLDQDDKPGGVYRFEGTYSHDRKDRFAGETQALNLAEQVTAPHSGEVGRG
jgi:hypothetical protein